MEENTVLVVLLAVFGSGGGAWLAVRTALKIHVDYLTRDIAEAKTLAREAHSHAGHAHERITEILIQKG